MSFIIRIAFIALFLTAVCFYAIIGNKDHGLEARAENSAKVDAKEPLHLSVTLQRVYLDGEMSEEVISETILSMEDFWSKYEKWQLVDMEDGKVIFQRKVNDISPLLKANGYFGVSKDGTLAIFNGKPDGMDIIQSFFQINFKKLETKRQQELLHGIPIRNKDDYTKVLETFKPYSTANY
ncbi:intercompartmental signaling factor BofC [Falsibacillus albus]|uniref:Regulator n=1 Tax=Falsibacillus albus TaxID=2478915 RepID=A0A3L7KBW6_9BACI|nr:intercompartmental signaling factor BofC [Falsibacillus albus]RLQ98082.1 regulator [Falsibacillus albus]